MIASRYGPHTPGTKTGCADMTMWHVDVPATAVALLSGERSRSKRFQFRDIGADTFEARLAELVAGVPAPGGKRRAPNDRRPDPRKGEGRERTRRRGSIERTVVFPGSTFPFWFDGTVSAASERCE